MSERPEAPIRDLLDGLTALMQRCLGGGRAVVLALDDEGSLQHVCPVGAAPDLVARALARSGSSLRSVGGDPPVTPPSIENEFGPALCVPVCHQDQMVGVLYAETGSATEAFPSELVSRLQDLEILPAGDPGFDDPPSLDGAGDRTNPQRAMSATTAIRSLAELERDAILHALQACRGNRTASARALGISVRKLQYRLKEYAEQGIVIG